MMGAAADLCLLKRLGRDLNSSPDKSSLTAAINGTLTIQDLLIETLLKVRSKTRGLVLLSPNRAQQEYGRKCGRRNVVLKARQLGITTYVAARFFIKTITQPGTVTVQVAHDQESAEEIFRIVHRFWENLPEGVQTGALMTSRANVRQIVFPRVDSEYRVATAADPNAGRGMTIHNLHCSEVARWPGDGAGTLSSLRSAVPGNGEIVLESTPNGAGGVFYDEWQRADETGYVRHFFPWWYDEAYAIQDARNVHPLSPEERALVDREGLRDAQIAWRRVNRAELRGLAAQEFGEDSSSCFLASGECVFDLTAVDRALQLCGEPVEMRDNGRLMIWFPAQVGKQYLIGVDPASGSSEGDYSCAEVVERRSGIQCAELHGHFPPRELATKLIELANYYCRALLVVERNNHGHGVLAHLQALGYLHVYRQGEQDGWWTSAVSRPAMVEILAAVLAEEPELFRSRRLLNEFRTFVRHADGKSAAIGGAHDDCVMAMAIALGARREPAGKNSSAGALDLASLPRRG